MILKKKANFHLPLVKLNPDFFTKKDKFHLFATCRKNFHVFFNATLHTLSKTHTVHL